MCLLPTIETTLPTQIRPPDNACGWHFEYGSATALFVLPRDSRSHLFAAASGSGDGGDIGVGSTEATECDGGGGGGGGGGNGRVASRGQFPHGAGAAGARGKQKEGGGRGGRGLLRPQEMPADENGVRDLLQVRAAACFHGFLV